MRSFHQVLFLTASSLIFVSCNTYFDKRGDLEVGPVDQKDFATFSYAKLEVVLKNNCYECHTVEKNHQPDLTSYAKVMRYVTPDSLNSDLYTALKNVGGGMPKGEPAISENSFDTIRLWILSGAPQFAGQGHLPIDGPTPPPADIQITVAGTYKDLNDKVFQKYCVGCHQPHPDEKKPDDRDPAGGIDMTSYQTFTTSESSSGLPVITPGDPNLSTLWDEMNKREMPKPESKARLSQSVTDAIAIWIKNGANND